MPTASSRLDRSHASSEPSFRKRLLPEMSYKVPDPAEEKKLDELYKNGFAKEHHKEYCEMEWKIEQQRMVGNPANASRIPSPCEMENEWPIHLFAHFEPLVVSDKALDIPKESLGQRLVRGRLFGTHSNY